MLKKCSKCGEWLNHEKFHMDKKQKDNLTSQCKKCRLKKKKEYDSLPTSKLKKETNNGKTS